MSRYLAPLFLIIIASAVFFTGIDWGLPSRSIDPYLFGSREPWSGQTIASFIHSSNDDPNRGADVDANPLKNRDHVLILNETDIQRAEIIRRYRLFTYQPDEMQTLMALAAMGHHHDLDPRLYKYGGLWIYPSGILLKLASILGWIDLRADETWYLDHPEAFGRFYILLRAYAATWGIVGVLAVFWLMRKLSAGWFLPTFAAAACALMPVIINMAHEAKPHLPGATLMLLAVIAAVKYIQTNRFRWALITGILCGAATGMVLSSLPIFVVLPIMALRSQSRTIAQQCRIIASAIGIAILVYLVTNPAVAINLLIHRERLASTLGNTADPYQFAHPLAGAANAACLLAEATSPLLAVAGLLGILANFFRRPRTENVVGLLLVIPALAMFIPIALVGAGWPGEYGRFLIFPAIVLLIIAFDSIELIFKSRLRRIAAGVILLIAVGIPGLLYVRTFIQDCSPVTPRLREADRLAMLASHGTHSIAIYAEPAPYVLPPIDLFTRQLVLLPRNYVLRDKDMPADVVLRPVDEFPPRNAPVPAGYVRLPPIDSSRISLFAAKISWAAKPFEILIRQNLMEPPMNVEKTMQPQKQVGEDGR